MDLAVAIFAIVAIGAHDYVHVSEGRYYDVFWVCNVAAALVGPAILVRSAVLSQVAMTWLLPGTVVWLADAFVAGSNILPTSYFIHLGGAAAAIYGVRVNGRARHGWLAALAMLGACVLFSRFFLPAHANVNAAHGVPVGWSFLGRTTTSFIVSGLFIVAVCCTGGHFLTRYVARRTAER